jgi:hypothetical protein
VKTLDGPVEGRLPYAPTCCLDAVCINPDCAATILIDNDADLYFASALMGEGLQVSAIILAWDCPICATANPIEEWTLADAHLPNWPPELSPREADAAPSSMLISASARRSALARYEAGQ